MKPVCHPELEEALTKKIASFEYDPDGFVMYAYPWGEPGTELENKTGPRKWQREFLRRVGRQLQAKQTTLSRVIREAVASGHGIGKSALIAWLIDWGMSTKADTRGIITAGTEPQLKTKTWPEIRKWFRMSINAHWWTVEETSITSTQEGHRDWRFDRVTWNKSQTESFAGLHNEGKRVLVFFDAASQIDDKIWEVVDGALTDEDTDIIFCVFGNPTRSVGAFRRCFGSERSLWSEGAPQQIDSRNVEGTNKEELQQLVDTYGENSDRVRVRVRGMFPSASSLQLIDNDLVAAAMNPERPASSMYGDPLIMTLDVARGGADNCVFRFRRGMDMRSIPPVRIAGSEVKDSMLLVSKAIELIKQYKPDAFFLDATGGYGAIADRIRQLGFSCIDVNFGLPSPDPEYLNLRAYMWVKLRDWLRAGGAIEFSAEVEQELCGVEYDHNDKQQLRLEEKKHMKARGLPSPDDGDAMAMTFAYPVAPTYKLKGESRKARTEPGPVSKRRRTG